MSDKAPVFVGAIAITALFTFIGTMALYEEYGMKPLRQQAVDGRHAEWVVDSKGAVTFRWIEFPPKSIVIERPAKDPL
jgi:hypothetical protein